MKAVWINPLSTGSTSLDSKINPHDVEQIALTSALQKEGFEVWLQESYKVKHKLSSWDKVVYPEDLRCFEADVAIIACNPFVLDYIGHRYDVERGWTARSKRLDLVANWLDKFSGDLYLFVPDPRPSFQKLLAITKGTHPIRKHLERAKVLVADPNFVALEHRHRTIVSEYWKLVKVDEPFPYNPDNDYFCVYPGLKFQNGQRRKLITNWLDREGCYTAGQLNLDGVPSITNYENVPLSKVLDITRRSTTSLICGEPTHTWLTPRVIQSMVCGTISSIHPEFAGSHHFPSEILLPQALHAASGFKVELSERVYDQQVEFIMSLSDRPVKSGVM